MRETQRKGDLAKAVAIQYFTSLKYDVAILLTESASYDLIVDADRLYRVQVKFTSVDDVDLRRIHSNSKGYQIKNYTRDSYDWLFVFKPPTSIYLLQDIDFSKKYISLRGRVPESGLTGQS